MNKKFYLIFTFFIAFSITATAQSTRFKSEIYTNIDTIGNIPPLARVRFPKVLKNIIIKSLIPPTVFSL